MLPRVSSRKLASRLPLLLAPLGVLACAAAVPVTSARAAVSPARLARATLTFIENQGQVRGPARYYVRGRDRSVYFTSTGVTYALLDREKQAGADRFRRYALKLDFVDADPGTRPVGEERQDGVIHHLVGPREQRRTGIPTYGGLRYRGIWRGVDLVYRGVEHGMKYEFRLDPGVDPGRIRLAYRGAESLRVDASGALVAETPAGEVTDAAPVAYQEIDGRRVEVPARYELRGAVAGRHEYGFRLGKYDSSRPLVVDPAVLIYCGYIGGSERDLGAGIAVDADGSAYVAGYTYSAQDTFPETVGFDSTYAGNGDAFVAKLTPDGSGLEYCTYLGGVDSDTATGIAVDALGRACVTGNTSSSEASFPVTVGPDLTYNGNGDAWVARLSADGSSLDYCGYVGGSERDLAGGVATDAAGRVFLTGTTYSSEATFPVAGGLKPFLQGPSDAFVAQVSASGDSLELCGYLGGTEDDSGNGIAVGPGGIIHVAGTTLSSHATFPVLAGPDLTYNGAGDAFIARILPDGTLALATYVGGAGSDQGLAVAVDPAGNTYLAGMTRSDERTFPVRNGPVLQHVNRPQQRRGRRGPLPLETKLDDGFVARLNANGVALDYCGFVGGAGIDAVLGVAADADGFAYIAGYTQSPQRTFPEIVGPDLKYGGGLTDAFVARVHSDGSRFNYCGYLGGKADDGAAGVAIDAAGSAYVVGVTTSAANTFPVRNGPGLPFNGGLATGFSDAFVAKISPFTERQGRIGRLVVSPKRLKFGTVRAGRSKTLKLRLRNGGGSPVVVNVPTLAAPFSVSQTGDIVLLPGTRRNLEITFTSTTNGRVRGGLVLTSNDPRSPLVQVPLLGRGR